MKKTLSQEKVSCTKKNDDIYSKFKRGDTIDLLKLPKEDKVSFLKNNLCLKPYPAVISYRYDEVVGTSLESKDGSKYIRSLFTGMIIEVSEGYVRMLQLDGTNNLLSMSNICSIQLFERVDSDTELLMSQYLNEYRDKSDLQRELMIVEKTILEKIAKKEDNINNHSILLNDLYLKKNNGISYEDFFNKMVNFINRSDHYWLKENISIDFDFHDKPYFDNNGKLYNTYSLDLSSSKKVLVIDIKLKIARVDDFIDYIIKKERTTKDNLVNNMFLLTAYMIKHYEEFLGGMEKTKRNKYQELERFMNSYIDYIHLCLSKSHNDIIFKNYININKHGQLSERLYIKPIRNYIQSSKVNDILNDFEKIADSRPRMLACYSEY